VYAVGHVALAPFAIEQAALLACGSRAVISHRTAAFAWGLRPDRPHEVEVTLVGSRCRPKARVRLHRVERLDTRDLRRRHNLPITSPARTLIDLAAEASLNGQVPGPAYANCVAYSAPRPAPASRARRPSESSGDCSGRPDCRSRRPT
jgi:hypothetical protein